MSDGDNADGGLAVGIDLGTTHCAIACGAPDGPLEIVEIPQVVDVGQVRGEELLPSFLYLPSEHEFSEGALDLPWRGPKGYIVGEFARAHGAKVPHRLVTSAKSWLCHDGVDRTANLLPWGADEEVPRLSAMEASTRYLKHLVQSWKNVRSGDGALGDQTVVLTVPASFDAVARDLTVQAAQAAGLEKPVLLEEPQAALYAWLDHQGDAWRNHMEKGDIVLVCDVGGGTTDFSLISIGEEEGQLVLRRVAVGDHILLGGDNMDLALAYTVRLKLQQEQGTRLDTWQLQVLTQGCRMAKEALLTDPDLPAQPLVIPSRGSKLIGGTIRAELTRDMVTSLLVEGFFPVCGSGDHPQQGRRAGLSEMGLPYASDAGVTRHLAQFLSRHVGAETSDGEQPAGNRSFVHPTAVLFNGGVLKAGPISERVTSVLNQWLAAEGSPAIKVLDSQSMDVSVARGAAYYGRVRQGAGIRIRGGIARSYYVGVEQAMPAVPGFEAPMLAMCLAPFGLEEGSSVEPAGEEFGLYVGEPAQFRFFGSSVRKADGPGDMIEDWDEHELEELPPVEAVLPVAKGETAGQRIAVTLKAEVTEIGTLVLSCVEKGGEGRAWTLEFNVRLRKDESEDAGDEDAPNPADG